MLKLGAMGGKKVWICWLYFINQILISYCDFAIKSRLSRGYFPQWHHWNKLRVFYYASSRITKLSPADLKGLIPLCVLSTSVTREFITSRIHLKEYDIVCFLKHTIKHEKRRYTLFILALCYPRSSSEVSSRFGYRKASLSYPYRLLEHQL